MHQHTSWKDHLIITLILTIVLLFLGQLCGLVFSLIQTNNPFLKTFLFYDSNLGVWLVIGGFCLLFKRERPLLDIVKKGRGNTTLSLFFGLLSGVVLNAFCVILAYLHNDFTLLLNSFAPLQLLALLFAVLIQSGAEELLVRGFMMQRLERRYSPLLAMIVSSMLFAALHLFNPHVTMIAVINLFLFGFFMALVTTFYQSLWMVIGIHAAWNYTQAIIFGLPNSGIPATYSIFSLMHPMKSAFYDPLFGIEGSLCAMLLLILLIAAIAFLNVYKWKSAFLKHE